MLGAMTMTIGVVEVGGRKFQPTKRFLLSDLEKGMTFTKTRVVRWWDILLTALVSDDFNRIHWDPFYSRRMGNRGLVAHGMLVMGLVSAAVGRHFLADGSHVTHLDAKFREKVYSGERVTITLTVIDVNRRGRVKIDVKVTNKTGGLIGEGTFDVWAPLSK